MSEASVRYLQMLDCIPRHPASTTVAALADELAERGFEVTQRSIQRDLDKLSGRYPLLCDDSCKPYRWSFDRSASLKTIPGMSTPVALTMKLAESYLRDLVPPKTLGHLEPHFHAANQFLQHSHSQLGHWANRVRVISKGLFIHRPRINTDVLEAVTEALLRQRQLAMVYQARHWPEPKKITVHPLGLVLREPNAYLISTIDGRKGTRQLVLHRCSHAELLGDSVVEPSGFDVDRYLASGAMHMLLSRNPIRFRARCDKPIMSHLLESPLALDQEVLAEDRDGFEIRATLGDTQDLRWWLMAQAPHMDLLEPAWLAEELEQTLTSALQRMGKIPVSD